MIHIETKTLLINYVHFFIFFGLNIKSKGFFFLVSTVFYSTFGQASIMVKAISIKCG